MQVADVQRGSAILIAVLSLFGAGCKDVGNTLTGLFVTKTPVPTVTPTPLPATSLLGNVDASGSPIAGATIAVYQGTQILSGTSNADSSYEISGLQPGLVGVYASAFLGRAGNHVTANVSITLVPGENALPLHLK